MKNPPLCLFVFVFLSLAIISQSMTIAVWDRLKDHHKEKLLNLPPHELVIRCVSLYVSVTKGR